MYCTLKKFIGTILRYHTYLSLIICTIVLDIVLSLAFFNRTRVLHETGNQESHKNSDTQTTDKHVFSWQVHVQVFSHNRAQSPKGIGLPYVRRKGTEYIPCMHAMCKNSK